MSWRRVAVARLRLVAVVVYLVALVLLPTASALAAPGDLVTGFGTAGVVTMDLSANNDSIGAVAYQSDGKIIVASVSYNSDMSASSAVIARLDADG